MTTNSKEQDIIQAVVIADKFTTMFAPLTDTGPLVLFPVGNMVLLECILQSLEHSKITETYVICCAHSQQIINYVRSSRWICDTSAMSVNVISSTSFLSMGDMMRELDSKAIIRSDFILIDGPVITNFSLYSMLEKHRKLRQTDKNCALTMLYRKALPAQRTTCKDHDLVVVHSSTKRVLCVQRANELKTLHIRLAVCQEKEEVDLHYDLLDCHIGICSPCVPPLFSNNYDYQTMEDFTKGLIVNEELLGNSMYINIAEKGYCACISNFYMYNVVSQDVMSRLTYPYVPDLVHNSKKKKYTLNKNNIYKQRKVQVGQNCQLLQNVIVGRGSRLGDNVVISNTVIGRNCIIGNHVIVKGAYIWDNSIVGDYCRLDSCLLGKEVQLLKKVIVNPGCVLGYKVIIDDGITIPSCTKLQSHVPVLGFHTLNAQEKEPKTQVHFKTPLVGIKGVGYTVSCVNDVSDDLWGSDPHVKGESSIPEVTLPGKELEEESDCGEGFDDDPNLAPIDEIIKGFEDIRQERKDFNKKYYGKSKSKDGTVKKKAPLMIYMLNKNKCFLFFFVLFNLIVGVTSDSTYICWSVYDLFDIPMLVSIIGGSAYFFWNLFTYNNPAPSVKFNAIYNFLITLYENFIMYLETKETMEKFESQIVKLQSRMARCEQFLGIPTPGSA